MSTTTDESPPPDGTDAPEDDDTAEAEAEVEEKPKPAVTPWADRWWVWALGGLAFAALILLLHLTSG